MVSLSLYSPSGCLSLCVWASLSGGRKQEIDQGGRCTHTSQLSLAQPQNTHVARGLLQHLRAVFVSPCRSFLYRRSVCLQRAYRPNQRRACFKSLTLHEHCAPSTNSFSSRAVQKSRYLRSRKLRRSGGRDHSYTHTHTIFYGCPVVPTANWKNTNMHTNSTRGKSALEKRSKRRRVARCTCAFLAQIKAHAKTPPARDPSAGPVGWIAQSMLS